MAAGPYVIGVEGGATKTLALLMGAGEQILARESGPSSNIHNTPHAEVDATLRRIVTSLTNQAGIGPHDLDAICLGMAGCDSEPDRKILNGFLEPILSPKTKVVIVNDAVPAMRGILGRLHGLLLIAGTGSICFGFNEKTGESSRCGGWGYLLADEGSGYALGLAALKAVMWSVDGRGPDTILKPRLLEHLKLSEPRGIISWIYGKEGTKTNVAALSRFVMDADAEGDEAAGRILDEQAAALLSLLPQPYKRLFAGDPDRVPLGVWGGNLVHGKRYQKRFLDGLAKLGLPLDPVITPEADAVLGAARHAVAAVGDLKV